MSKFYSTSPRVSLLCTFVKLVEDFSHDNKLVFKTFRRNSS